MPDSDIAPESGWYSNEAATFGDRVTAAREARGLSVGDLSRRLGVRTTTLSAWENDFSEPRANKLQMLAGLLNVSLSWLLTGEGDGLDGPAGERVLSAGVSELLLEMRQIRSDLQRAAERLGVLEKRFKMVTGAGG